MKRLLFMLMSLVLIISCCNVNVLAVSKSSLKVISSDPVNNAKEVHVDKNLSINFNMIIKQGISFNKITLIDSKKNKIKFTTKISNKTLVIETVQYMDYATKYTLSIPVNAVKSQSSGAYNSLISISFTTDTQKPVLEFDYINQTQPDENGFFDTAETHIEKDSIGTPILKLVATNVSNKEIVAFEFTCSFLDDFNRPVYKLGTKNTVFTGVVQGAKIPSIKDAPNNWGEFSFNLAVYNLATQVKDYLDPYAFKITLVKYADGSIWKAQK